MGMKDDIASDLFLVYHFSAAIVQDKGAPKAKAVTNHRTSRPGRGQTPRSLTVSPIGW